MNCSFEISIVLRTNHPFIENYFFGIAETQMPKRLFDLVISTLLLTLAFPLILIIAMMVWYFLGQPIIFRQSRPGLNGKPFMIYKFRTMLDLHDSYGNHLPDNARLTNFGKWLRASSFDEIPELFNVIMGDMSLVGPRPLLMQYLPLYNKFQYRRHEIRPGITGLAQINGRNLLSWKKKFELDVWYVDNHNLILDLIILYLTIKKVIFREGINQVDQATTRYFEGTDD